MSEKSLSKTTLAMTVLVVLECLGIGLMEIFLWERMGTSIDPTMTPDFLSATVSMAANQGIYNVLLGVVGIYGIVRKDRGTCVLTACLVIAAAAFGAATVSPAIIIKQGGLPLVALVVMLARK